jgi:protein TonB
MGTSRGHGRSPQSWEHLFDRDPHSAAGFRLGIAAAVVIHLGIFAVTWPTVAQAPPTEPEREVVRIRLADLAPPDPPERPPIEAPPPPVSIPPVISIQSEQSHVEPARHDPPESIEIPAGAIVVPPVNQAPPAVVVDSVTETVRVGVHVDPPEILHKVEPTYTRAAIVTRVRGAVILELMIDTRGRVESVTVLRGLPMGLSQSAVDAVSQWRFEPCTLDGDPVNVKYILTVRFDLK